MGSTGSNFPWTDRQIKSGRGQGVGKDYTPWIHVRDFSSRGKSSRFKSWKHGRVIQLLSDIELAFAYLLEWSDVVLDYQEQFPLLPLEETLELAERVGVKIPIDPDTKEPRVRTTDFLIRLQEGGRIGQHARAIKPADHLKKKPIVLGLELERQFWNVRQTDWAIVTERDLPMDMAKNIEWIHDARTLDDHQDVASLPLPDILPTLRSAIQTEDRSLAHACLDVDKKLGLRPSTCLLLVRHQLATKAWSIDMHKPIKTHEPLTLLPAPNEEHVLGQGVA